MSKKLSWEEQNEKQLEKALGSLGSALENAASSSITDYAKENVKTRAKAGLKEIIIREELASCCKWCRSLAGQYDYGTEPVDVYRRHDNCKCIVLFRSEKGKYRDVWSKKEYESYNKAREERIKIIDKKTSKGYNVSPDLEQLQKQYEEDVQEGWISALCGFDNYLRLFNRINREIVGEATVDGITITGFSRHFMQRVIGTGVDPKILKEDLKVVRRSGVEIEDIKEALINGTARKSIMRRDGVWSRKYVSDKCMVSINPETGNLIQCNGR